jgi:hypothetical protein
LSLEHKICSAVDVDDYLAREMRIDTSDKMSSSSTSPVTEMVNYCASKSVL